MNEGTPPPPHLDLPVKSIGICEQLANTIYRIASFITLESLLNKMMKTDIPSYIYIYKIERGLSIMHTVDNSNVCLYTYRLNKRDTV